MKNEPKPEVPQLCREHTDEILVGAVAVAGAFDAWFHAIEQDVDQGDDLLMLLLDACSDLALTV